MKQIKELIVLLFKYLGYRVSKEIRLPSSDSLTFNITYLDVGSSGGLGPNWNRYINNDLFNAILVEPDVQEAENLKKMYPKSIVIPHALGSVEGKAILNVTEGSHCSSILTPNYELLKRFPVNKWFRMKDKIEINLYPFTSLAAQFNLGSPDFVKMDVQGFESEVLKGFGNYLDSILCIELETHLMPLYIDQKTIEGITHFLSTKGFFLRHLVTIGIFEEEVLEFGAYFVRKPELVKTELERKKIDFWCKVNQVPPGSYFKDWDK